METLQEDNGKLFIVDNRDWIEPMEVVLIPKKQFTEIAELKDKLHRLKTINKKYSKALDIYGTYNDQIEWQEDDAERISDLFTV